jgi:hypothetical protein
MLHLASCEEARATVREVTGEMFTDEPDGDAFHLHDALGLGAAEQLTLGDGTLLVQPPRRLKVSPEMARSAMKNTVASATSVSVGMLRRWSMPSTPLPIFSASRWMPPGQERLGRRGQAPASQASSARALAGRRETPPLRSRATSRAAMRAASEAAHSEYCASATAARHRLGGQRAHRGGPPAASCVSSLLARARAPGRPCSCRRARPGSPPRAPALSRLFSWISRPRRRNSPALPPLPAQPLPLDRPRRDGVDLDLRPHELRQVLRPAPAARPWTPRSRPGWDTARRCTSRHRSTS